MTAAQLDMFAGRAPASTEAAPSVVACAATDRQNVRDWEWLVLVDGVHVGTGDRSMCEALAEELREKPAKARELRDGMRDLPGARRTDVSRSGAGRARPSQGTSASERSAIDTRVEAHRARIASAAGHVCRGKEHEHPPESCPPCAEVRAGLVKARATGPKSPRASKHDPKRGAGSPRMARDVRERRRGRAGAE